MSEKAHIRKHQNDSPLLEEIKINVADLRKQVGAYTKKTNYLSCLK
jgi:hypothetical protein